MTPNVRDYTTSSSESKKSSSPASSSSIDTVTLFLLCGRGALLQPLVICRFMVLSLSPYLCGGGLRFRGNEGFLNSLGLDLYLLDRMRLSGTSESENAAHSQSSRWSAANWPISLDLVLGGRQSSCRISKSESLSSCESRWRSSLSSVSLSESMTAGFFLFGAGFIGDSSWVGGKSY